MITKFTISKCMWQRASLALLAVALVLCNVYPVFAQENETATSWFMKGYNLYYEGRYNESLDAYNRALVLDSSNSEAWNNKGIDEGLLGKYASALNSFENAVSINSTYAEAWYNMGVIYDMQGDSYNAVQAYKKATQINPEYQKAWVRRNVNSDQIMARSLSCSCQDPITYV